MKRSDRVVCLRYALLERLRQLPLPAEFTDPNEIDDVLALSSSKLVEAALPEPVRTRQGLGYSGCATVIKLTPLGRILADTYIDMRKPSAA